MYRFRLAFRPDVRVLSDGDGLASVEAKDCAELLRRIRDAFAVMLLFLNRMPSVLILMTSGWKLLICM